MLIIMFLCVLTPINTYQKLNLFIYYFIIIIIIIIN